MNHQFSNERLIFNMSIINLVLSFKVTIANIGISIFECISTTDSNFIELF